MSSTRVGLTRQHIPTRHLKAQVAARTRCAPLARELVSRYSEHCLPTPCARQKTSRQNRSSSYGVSDACNRDLFVFNEVCEHLTSRLPFPPPLLLLDASSCALTRAHIRARAFRRHWNSSWLTQTLRLRTRIVRRQSSSRAGPTRPSGPKGASPRVSVRSSAATRSKLCEILAATCAVSCARVTTVSLVFVSFSSPFLPVSPRLCLRPSTLLGRTLPLSCTLFRQQS